MLLLINHGQIQLLLTFVPISIYCRTWVLNYYVYRDVFDGLPLFYTPCKQYCTLYTVHCTVHIGIEVLIQNAVPRPQQYLPYSFRRKFSNFKKKLIIFRVLRRTNYVFAKNGHKHYLLVNTVPLNNGRP